MPKYIMSFPFTIKQVSERSVEIEATDECLPAIIRPEELHKLCDGMSDREVDRLMDDAHEFIITESFKRRIHIAITP